MGRDNDGQPSNYSQLCLPASLLQGPNLSAHDNLSICHLYFSSQPIGLRNPWQRYFPASLLRGPDLSAHDNLSICYLYFSSQPIGLRNPWQRYPDSAAEDLSARRNRWMRLTAIQFCMLIRSKLGRCNIGELCMGIEFRTALFVSMDECAQLVGSFLTTPVSTLAKFIKPVLQVCSKPISQTCVQNCFLPADCCPQALAFNPSHVHIERCPCGQSPLREN